MRAVAGSVESSELISLRRAAGIISNFTGSYTGARPEVAAYIRRASKAFDEFVRLRREIRGEDRKHEERQNKRKRKWEAAEAGGDDIAAPRQQPDEIREEGRERSGERIKDNKKKNQEAELTDEGRDRDRKKRKHWNDEEEGGGLTDGGRDRDLKNRKHSNAEEEGGGLTDDRSGCHKKTKRGKLR